MESIEKIIEFNPEAVIHQISPRPLCIVVTAGYDMIHPIEHIFDAYKKANEPRKSRCCPTISSGSTRSQGAATRCGSRSTGSTSTCRAATKLTAQDRAYSNPSPASSSSEAG